MNRDIRARVRRPNFIYLAVAAAFSLFLLTALNAQANTVWIDDQSRVLDVGKVRAEAAKLANSMLIYTTKIFNGDQNALNQSTRIQLPNEETIAIGIDTIQRHLSIESGIYVKLSDSQASDAVSAFRNNYNGGDYTSATIAAIDSLQSALTGGGSSSNPVGVVIGILIAVGAIILVVFAVIRFRSRPPQSGGRGGRWIAYFGGAHNTGTYSSKSYGGGAGGGFV